MKCSICICKIRNIEDLYITPCKHNFHKKCMDDLILFNIQNKLDILCPNCRNVLSFNTIPPQHIEIQIDTAVPQIIIENESSEIIHKKIMHLYVTFGIIVILMYILYYLRHFLQSTTHIPSHK